MIILNIKELYEWAVKKGIEKYDLFIDGQRYDTEEIEINKKYKEIIIDCE